jgi:integral membrane sensor domain MASE1
MSGQVLYSLTTAAGNSLEVISAALLLRHVARFDLRMERARDVVALLICGGAVSACASALFGILGMHLSGMAPVDALPRIGWKWALGHAMGMIAVTPFVLTLSSWWKGRKHPGSCGEASALFLLLFVVGSIAFWGGVGIFTK